MFCKCGYFPFKSVILTLLRLVLSSSAKQAFAELSNVLHTDDMLILTVSFVVSDTFESTLLIFNFFSNPFDSSFDRTSLLINVISEPLSKRAFVLIFFIY